MRVAQAEGLQSNKQNGWKNFLPYLFFIVFSLVYFWPVLFGSGILLPTNPKTIPPWNEIQSSDPSNGLMIDSITLLYPWRIFNSSVLRSGEIPHWNPYVFCGYPHLAGLQTNSLYPGTILFDLIDPVWGIAGAMAFHFAISGILMFLFLKRIGLPVEASFLGALVFEFNGMFLIRMSSPTYVYSAVWIPLMLIGSHNLAQNLKFRSSLPLIFGAALSFLGGHPQIFLLANVLSFSFFIFEIRNNFSLKKFIVGSLGFGIASLTGLALAAFELIPFAELIRNTSRESVSLEIYKKAAPPFVIALQAVIPDFFGHPVDKNYWFNQGAELLGRGNKFGAPWSFNYSGENLYSGIVPLLLAGVAVLKNRIAVTLFFFVVLLLSLGILFGTPILDAAYYLLPSFRFSRPDRIIILYMVCLSVLTALGYQALQQWRSTKSEKSIGLWTIATLILFIVALIIPYGIDSQAFEGFQKWMDLATEKFHQTQSAENGTLIAVGVFIAFVLLSFLLIMVPASNRFVLPILALLIFLPCYFFGWKFNPIQHSPLFPANQPQTILADGAPDELYRIVRIFGRRGQKYFPSNVPGVFGVFDVNGASAAPVHLYTDFVTAIDSRAITKEKYFWEFTNPKIANRPLFDFLNVKYVISDTALPFEEEPVFRHEQFRIYKNAGALERFFLVYSVETYGDISEAHRRMLDRNFEPSKTVLISENEIRRIEFPYKDGSGAVRLLSYKPNKIELEVKSNEKALLVSSEAFYPGWRARIDGRPAPVVLVNSAFRGISVPAGDHKISFVYSSVAFKIGAVISLVTFSLVLILIFTARR